MGGGSGPKNMNQLMPMHERKLTSLSGTRYLVASTVEGFYLASCLRVPIAQCMMTGYW